MECFMLTHKMSAVYSRPAEASVAFVKPSRLAKHV